MRLAALLERLKEAQLLIEGDAAGPGSTGRIEKINRKEIDHLADDSRAVGPEGLFVAVRGEETDGHLFIDKAVQKKAGTVVCEDVPSEVSVRFPNVTFVQVADTRAALAELAAAFYGDPSEELEVVGVTGTNGKTTTAFLLRHMLRALGRKAALIGTIETDLGEGPRRAALTTPGALEMQRMLRTAADNGCTACAMEVSSHALVQERVRSVAYDVGIFTNLSPEHLDYHGSLERYRAAKKRLFDALTPAATALYNADDAAGREVTRDTRARTKSYGQASGVDIRVEVEQNRLDGLALRLDGVRRTFQLVGLFNAYNLAAAYGTARALGFEQAATLDALAEAPPVPGRFEKMRASDGRVVIVDYAHTPDALENVLETIRATKGRQGHLWCVFGCGGDRDSQKRPVMGRLAERLADRVIVTSDNPRTEDPEDILEDIRHGMDRPEDALWMVDRRMAIREAARQSGPGDVVLIAGKGHETYQIVGVEKRSFDDREEAKRHFAMLEPEDKTEDNM